VLMEQLAQLAPRDQPAVVVLAAMEQRPWPATGPGSHGSPVPLPMRTTGDLFVGPLNKAYLLLCR
jgi:hypothetical protein